MAIVVQHPLIGKQNQAKKQSLPIADSSYLMNVDYDAQNLLMTVTMKTGAQYQYFFVYPNVMEEFTKAPSKGAFYAKVVKGQHKGTRLIDKNVGKEVKKT